MSNNINLNINPYYDDFSDDKQYQRILFKPGYAVQARELTQLQTILQKQVERFGNRIFREGAVITGCDYALNLRVPYVKILDTDSSSATISNDDLLSYEGQVVIHQSSGLRAVIKKATAGFETTVNKTLHVQYLNQGTNGTTTAFPASATLELEDDATVTFVVGAAGIVPTGFGSLFSLNQGIVYGKGTFVVHNNQTIVLEPFSSTPTKTVGINIVESIVNADADATLLDPATGTYNYTAPGADRLKVTTELEAFDPNTVVADEFNVLFDIVNGQVSRRYDITDYGELNKVLARRTFDESGDYTLRPFALNIREHLKSGDNGGVYTSGNGGDTGKLVLGVSAGKAYVKGYEYQTYATQYFDIEKETDTRDIEEANISTAYGYYVIVDDVAGVAGLNAGTLVQLHNVVLNAASGGAYSATSAPGSGTLIGTARIQSIEYHSGTIGQSTCEYRLYLSEIKMTSSAFTAVKSFYAPTTPAFFADAIGSGAVLQDTSFNTLLFDLPNRNVSTLDLGAGFNNEFVYRKALVGTVTTAGTVTFSLSGNETFAFSSNTTTIRNNEIMLVATQEMQVSGSPKYKSGQIIPIGAAPGASTAGITSLTTTSLTIDVTTDTLDASYGVLAYVAVKKSDTNPRSKTLRKNRIIKLQISKTFSGITATTGSTDVTGFSSLTADDVAVGDKVYNDSGTLLGTVATVDTVTPKLVLTANAAVAVTAGNIIVAHPSYNVTTKILTSPLPLGQYDVIKINSIKAGSNTTAFNDITTLVTEKFELNSGQTDTLYDISTISKKAKEIFDFDAANNKRLVVDFDYFEHSNSSSLGGYFTVDSYPLPTQGVAANPATEIEWIDMPRYTSPNGSIKELRDVIDFRPTVTAVGGIGTSVGSTILNPTLSSETSKSFLSGIYTPHAQEEFRTDVQYNVPRIDRVILNSEGEFEILEGVPDPTPIARPEPGNAMTLGTVFIPPFPSTSPKVARSLNRTNFSALVATVDNRRFTMRDIGNLETRLENLRKFTEISFLEQKLLNTSLTNETGEERPKNGILVDDFIDHSRGNVEDPNYSCVIFNGILQPSLKPVNVHLEPSTLTNLVRTSSDIQIVVEQTTNAQQYIVGETVTNGSGASGVVKHIVPLATDNTTNYRWVRLYLEEGIGTFAITNTITGSTSTAVGTIPTVTSTTNISAGLFPLVLRPDAVVAATSGNLITLPYTHSVYAENPYASEAINTTNNLLFKYEGNITLSPPCDTWFDEENAPEGSDYTLPTSGSTSWFASVAAPPKAAVPPAAPTSPTGSPAPTAPTGPVGGTGYSSGADRSPGTFQIDEDQTYYSPYFGPNQI